MILHWFLPTNGDSRTDLSLGNAVGAAGSRVADGSTERAPDIGYIGQIARSAEQLGFTGALTPTSSWCEDAWVMTAALTQVTERFRYLVAFRPGLMSPTLAAHMAATYQRISGGRLLLNIVTGGDDGEQQRFGDHLGKHDRYQRCAEFLHVVRELWTGQPVEFRGEHYDIRGAQLAPARVWPDIYLGGSSADAIGSGAGTRLQGRKYYCTGAITARWIGVSAVDDAGRLVLAFVERDATGVKIDEDWDVMGQRATVSGSAAFDDVVVDPGLVVPYESAFAVPQQLGARAQLWHAAIQVGIAGGALRDAGAFVTGRARPFFEAVRAGWTDSAATDPHTMRRYGELATKVAAAEALLASAAATLDEVTRFPRDAAEAARGSIAVAQAKAFGSAVAVEVASDLFALSGASAADERHDLSRHWRNARTHASHDPADWKYHHVGNFLLNNVPPPNHGQI